MNNRGGVEDDEEEDVCVDPAADVSFVGDFPFNAKARVRFEGQTSAFPGPAKKVSAISVFDTTTVKPCCCCCCGVLLAVEVFDCDCSKGPDVVGVANG